MSMNVNKSTLIESFTRPVLSSVTFIEEGTPLVAVFEGGQEVVKAATGAANETFVGFAVSEAVNPNYAYFSERIQIPATGAKEITLARAPVTTQSFAAIIEDGVGAPTIITLAAGSADATHVKIVGKVVTFDATFAGMYVEFRYKYQMTMSEINLAYPVNDPKVRYTEVTNLGIVSKGTILVDNFDMAVDWAAFNAVSNPVTLGNGVVTLGGSGTVIPVDVAGLPYANGGFLALRVNA